MEPDVIDMMEAEQLRVCLRKSLLSLHRIVEGADSPSISPTGGEEFGLYCGVEDRMCSDRYEGANVGYETGAERMLEWAVNEAKEGLLL